MAFNDTEIEIKIPLEKKKFDEVRQRVRSMSDFVKELHQVDEYYNAVDRDFIEPQYPFEWLSLRQRGDKALVNFKHWYPENSEVCTHCDEFETVIENLESMKKIFDVMGIKPLVAVDKKREVYKYQDKFEIGLDEVKDLGCFIEIEALTDLGGVEKTREELLKFAQELGCDLTKLDYRGYPYLLINKLK